MAAAAGGLTLRRVASAVPSAASVSYADAPTLAAVAAAVNGLGGGWAATVTPGYELWPAADLRAPQGAYPALGEGAELELFAEEVPAGTGSSWGYGGGPPGWWRLEPGPGLLLGRWPRGRSNVRVDCVAGFPETPAAVQDATVLLAKFLIDTGGSNRTVGSFRLGDYSQGNAGEVPAMPEAVRGLIAPYVDHAKRVAP